MKKIINNSLTKVASIVGGIVLAGVIGFIGAQLSSAIKKPTENERKIELIEREVSMVSMQIGEILAATKELNKAINDIEKNNARYDALIEILEKRAGQ